MAGAGSALQSKRELGKATRDASGRPVRLIGTVQDIAKAVPANFKPLSIAPANGNGNGHSNGNGSAAKKEEAAEAVAGD